jgi:tetratricopeptide (TPR) repeat protein
MGAGDREIGSENVSEIEPEVLSACCEDLNSFEEYIMHLKGAAVMSMVNRVLSISLCVFVVAAIFGCAVPASNLRTEIYRPVTQPGKTFSDAANDFIKILHDVSKGGVPIKCVIAGNKIQMFRQADGQKVSSFYLYQLLDHPIVLETDRRLFITLPDSSSINFDQNKLDEAKTAADALYVIQQVVKNYRDKLNRELANFEPVAAQYRSLGNKPQIAEEQRKLIVQANALTEQKQFVQAREKYRQAMELDRTAYPAAYFNLALLEAQMNLPFAAVAYMKQYLLLAPDARDARSAQDKIYEWELLMPTSRNISGTGGYLGVKIQPTADATGFPSGFQEGNGVLVLEVMKNSPAEQAGLGRGDMVLTFDGNGIKEMSDLPRMVASTPPGKTVELNILRKGHAQTVKVKIGKLPN